MCHIATADKPPTIWRPRDDNAKCRFTLAVVNDCIGLHRSQARIIFDKSGHRPAWAVRFRLIVIVLGERAPFIFYLFGSGQRRLPQGEAQGLDDRLDEDAHGIHDDVDTGKVEEKSSDDNPPAIENLLIRIHAYTPVLMFTSRSFHHAYV